MSKKPKKGPKKLYCWDTSVFIAWLADDPKAPLADMKAIVAEIDAKRINLLFPVTVHTEILEVKREPHEAENFSKFNRFRLRSNVLLVDTTFPIAERARKLRDDGLRLKEKRSIKTPDAHIIATAIMCGAHVLHSTDPDMLNLDGLPIVDGLNIKLPVLLDDQESLFLD